MAKPYYRGHDQWRKANPLREGTPCPRCGSPMYSKHKLDVGHTIDAALGGAYGPRRYEHSFATDLPGEGLADRSKRPDERHNKMTSPSKMIRIPKSGSRYLQLPTELPKDIADRFWSKVEVDPDTTCWNWTAQKQGGYGRFGLYGSSSLVLAHRLSHALTAGDNPDHLYDHVCRNHSCVNPAHLEPTTHRGNTLTGTSQLGVNMRKTHCVRDHELSGPNLYMHPSGRRVCRACRDMHRKAYIERKKNR